jgi:hypothetical protein
MSLYMGRAVTSAGGLAAALKSVAAAMLFNPIAAALVVIAGIGAKAYSVWSATSDKIEESHKRIADAIKEQKAAADASLNTVIRLGEELAVLNKVISPEEARTRAIQAGLPSSEDARAIAERQANAEFEVATKKRAVAIAEQVRSALDLQGVAQAAMVREELANERRRFFDKQDNDGIKAKQRAESEYQDLLEKRRSTLQALALDFGGKKLSDFMTGPEREMVLFRESAAERLKAAGESGTGFGISTRGASGFRFGPGAVGSVIGEQSEQKNTTKAIKDLERTIVREFEAKWPNVTGPRSAWNGP